METVDEDHRQDGELTKHHEEHFKKHHGKFRRHSSAIVMHKGMANGFHRRPVELYLVRLNPPCRAVWLYMLQQNIPHILIDIDFGKGEERLPEAIRKQPHRDVPIVIDGDVVVFEGPAILTYLAAHYTDYSGYGITLQNRMLCESLLSWANSELHRAVGYNYIYPQFLEKYTLPTESATESLVESGLKLLSRHLEILEKKYLDKSRFLVGNRLTVADTYIACILMQVEWTGTKFKMWPKVEAWLERVRNQEHWDTVHLSHNLYLRELERAALFH